MMMGRAPAAASGVSDTFNRADNASSLGTADTGQVWSALQGTWGISTKQAYRTSTVDSDQAILASGLVNAKTTATLGVVGANGEFGVTVRCDGANNHYLAIVINSGGTALALYKRVAGTYTQLGSNAAVANWTTGDTISVEAVGTTIRGFRNGVSVISQTDSSLASGTGAGIRAGGTATTARWDNFLVEAA